MPAHLGLGRQLRRRVGLLQQQLRLLLLLLCCSIGRRTCSHAVGCCCCCGLACKIKSIFLVFTTFSLCKAPLQPRFLTPFRFLIIFKLDLFPTFRCLSHLPLTVCALCFSHALSPSISQISKVFALFVFAHRQLPQTAFSWLSALSQICIHSRP